MITEFKKFAGFKILWFFVFNPRTEIYINELAKKLGISPSTAKFYCDIFSDEGIINTERRGNIRFSSLNNASVYVKELKRLLALLHFKESGIEKISGSSTSLAIYGSHASGEFEKDSDLDIIVLGKEGDVDKDYVLRFEKKVGKRVQVTVMPYHKWEIMKKQKDPFALEVLSDNILVSGKRL